jgi:hypothetical protein
MPDTEEELAAEQGIKENSVLRAVQAQCDVGDSATATQGYEEVQSKA